MSKGVEQRSEGEPISVAVAILTFRRPDDLRAGLAAILPQVEELNASGVAHARVQIIDNDPAGSARPVVEALADPLVSYCVEERPGISAARNRAFDETADSRLLCFIDDDEIPGPRWLEHLIDRWLLTRPAAVCGWVVPEFERQPSDFIEAGGFFQRRNRASGTELEAAAAGNLLLDLDQVRASGVRFAERYGLSGGEDTLFSRTLHGRGYRIVWCADSWVVDRVPSNRMTREWVLMRAWSHGNAAGLIEIDLRGTRPEWLARLAVAGAGLARVVGGAARFGAGVVARSLRHRARGLRLMRRGGGMLSAATGRVFQEYAR